MTNGMKGSRASASAVVVTVATVVTAATVVTVLALGACGQKAKVTSLDQLAEGTFAVPTGTIADKLVQSKFPKAKFQYFNSVLDSAMAVRGGKADAAAYDEPILRNIAAKNDGLDVLPGMITTDRYGIAVPLDRADLKAAVDGVLAEVRANGRYAEMMGRWLPKTGAPAAMPPIPSAGTKGVLRLGTSAVTEPFSFIDGSRKVVGLDIEIAALVAAKLDMTLEVVNMEFGSMIPALKAGKVDLIAACITISDERAKSVLFSEPYYTGGIAALVKR